MNLIKDFMFFFNDTNAVFFLGIQEILFYIPKRYFVNTIFDFPAQGQNGPGPLRLLFRVPQRLIYRESRNEYRQAIPSESSCKLILPLIEVN